MRLCVFSDLHVHAWSEYSHDDRGAPSRLRHCISVLQKVRSHCVEHEIQHVLFGGDLFHRRGVLYTQAYNLVCEELAEWKRAGLSLLANVGNHDMADRSGKIHALQALESTGLLRTVGGDGWANWTLVTKNWNDVSITAVAYCSDAAELRHRTDAALEDRREDTKFSIGLFHHGFRGARVGTSLEYVVKEDSDPDEYAKHFTVMLCVDEETEALTPDGWRKHHELSVGDRIGAVNEGGMFRWEPMSQVNRFPNFRGSVVHIGGGKGAIDHFSTLNHTMWVRRWNGATERGSGSHLFGAWHRRMAKDVPRTAQYSVLVAALDWRGEFSWNGPLTGSKLDLAEYVGWYVSEGHAGPLQVGLAQSREANPEKYEQIVSLVDRLGYRPSLHSLMVRICSKVVATWTAETFGVGCQNKHIPRWVKGWPRHLLAHLLRTMIQGDGHQNETDSATYHTTSKQLADDVQEIAFKVGWGTTASSRLRDGRTKRCYDITIVEKDERQLSLKRKQVDNYRGLVWCPTVSTGLWVSRRNGRVVVTGNSGHYHAHQEIGTLGNAWYVGSPMEFVRGETSPKGFLVLDTDSAEFERVTIGLPRFVKLLPEQVVDEDFDVGAHVRGNFVDVVFEELPMPWDSLEGVLRGCGALGVRACPTRSDKLKKSSRLSIDPTQGDRQLLESYLEYVKVDPSERDVLLQAGLSLLEETTK